MTPEQEKIVADMGFEVCTFGPDADPCEECKRQEQQLYFSGPVDAGIYLCLDCILAAHAANEKYAAEMVELEQAGHTPHCAARHVWGDGQCECRGV